MNKKIPVDRFLHSSSLKNVSFKEKTILLKNEADQNLEGQEVEDKVKLRKWREEAILFKQMVNTSLIDAVRKGDLKQAKGLIIDFGLSYSKEWSDGYALLREALINKHIAIVKLLLHNDCKINIEYGRCSDTPLHLAVIYGDIEVIKMILDKGARINAKNIKNNGTSPLHLAASRGHKQILDCLLNHGADIDIRKNDGTSPLHLAASRGHKQIVDCLFKHGADTDVRKSDGISPLHSAASRGRARIVDCLLKQRAHVNVKKDDGTTPLHLAAYRGHTQIVDCLLKHGAAANVRKNNGASPLHEAALTGYSQSVKILLKFGARVNSRDKNERTALNYAYSKGRLEAVETLLEFGSDISFISKIDCTTFADDMNRLFSYKSYVWGHDHGEFRRFSLDGEYIRSRLLATKYIIHHVVKMVNANLFRCQTNSFIKEIMKTHFTMVILDYGNDDDKNFRLQHVRELESMERKKIPNSNVSFYEILAKGESSLAAFMRNKNVMEFLETANYEAEYPLYASILRSHFRKGVKRNDLVEPANRSFNYIFKNLTELPYDCIEKIFSYLSNEDLEDLKDVLS